MNRNWGQNFNFSNTPFDCSEQSNETVKAKKNYCLLLKKLYI
jgi:hypothetical protein